MDPYSELLKVISSEQIDQEVEVKIDSFHGLLTREVALRLIAKEKGLLKEEEKFFKISEIKSGNAKDSKRISVSAKVEKILPEVVYPSGKRARSILLKDGGGEIALKLWEESIALCSKIRTGSQVTIRNAYEKFGDLNLGYRGTLEITAAEQYTSLDSLPEGNKIHVYTKVSRVAGEVNNGFVFYVSDSRNEVTVILREGKDRGKKIQEGDLIIIDNGLVSGGEIILDSDSRLLLKHQKDLVSGKITELKGGNNQLWVEIGGKKLVFDRENAIKFLNVSVSEDISLETLAELKKDSLLNSVANIRVKEDNGRFIILR